MNQFKYIFACLGIYAACYTCFAISGAIIHNDTLEYIAFANKFRHGVFPHSSLYQPGVGFFIALINYLFGLDYFDSFRVLNFIYGIGIILILKSVFISLNNKITTNIVSIILLSTSPFIALFSYFLYADIGFIFYSLLSLFILSRYIEKRKLYLLFLSSLFVTISIFTKYNGLSVLLTGIVYLLIYGLRKKSIIGAVKEVVYFALFPFAYIVFWKLYNGNLGGVEFNSYLRVVNLDCMIQYLKINVISLYHLFLDTIFFSAHTKVNHYLLTIPLIGLITLWLFYTKAQNKQYLNRIKNNNSILLFYLYALTYTCSMIGIQSLNCITEIDVRMFLTPIIILSSIVMHYLVFVFNESETKIKKTLSILLLISTLFYNVYYLGEYNKVHDQFKFSKTNNRYSNVMKQIIESEDLNTIYATHGFIRDYHIMREINKGKDLKTIDATPGYGRDCYILGKKLNELKEIPYQIEYDYDIKYDYTNAEYFNLIKESFSKLDSKQFLIIEFNPTFIEEYQDSIKNLNIISKDNGTYLFKKP